MKAAGQLINTRLCLKLLITFFPCDAVPCFYGFLPGHAVFKHFFSPPTVMAHCGSAQFQKGTADLACVFCAAGCVGRLLIAPK